MALIVLNKMQSAIKCILLMSISEPVTGKYNAMPLFYFPYALKFESVHSQTSAQLQNITMKKSNVLMLGMLIFRVTERK